MRGYLIPFFLMHAGRRGIRAADEEMEDPEDALLKVNSLVESQSISKATDKEMNMAHNRVKRRRTRRRPGTRRTRPGTRRRTRIIFRPAPSVRTTTQRITQRTIFSSTCPSGQRLFTPEPNTCRCF